MRLALRSDREVIYVDAADDVELEVVEIELRLAWLEVLDGLVAGPEGP